SAARARSARSGPAAGRAAVGSCGLGARRRACGLAFLAGFTIVPPEPGAAVRAPPAGMNFYSRACRGCRYICNMSQVEREECEMPKRLTKAAVEAYHRDGFYFPVPVLSAAEAADYRRRLEAHEAKTGAPLQGNWRHKTHLLFTWADELVHHPAILDAVEDVIGPNILCWTTNFFIKEARSPGFVSWHQDSTYWGLEPDDVVTAWVAFTRSDLESGCMKVIPGTQRSDQIEHVDTF